MNFLDLLLYYLYTLPKEIETTDNGRTPLPSALRTGAPALPNRSDVRHISSAIEFLTGYDASCFRSLLHSLQRTAVPVP